MRNMMLSLGQHIVFLSLISGMLVVSHSTQALAQAARATASQTPSTTKPDTTQVTIPDITFVSIPGGTFQMGSDKGNLNEKPVHSVTLSAFEMSATEITQGQYKALMGKNPSSFQVDDSNPVENVTWEAATAFCRQLTLKTGRLHRLPTEAEWEYACRAGSQTTFSSGNSESDLAKVGWFFANSDIKPHPVAQKAPNAWGLFDMHGNVWEWCSDFYSAYTSESVTNPTGPETGTTQVRRGGSWSDNADFCGSTLRYRFARFSPNGTTGFRIVRKP